MHYITAKHNAKHMPPDSCICKTVWTHHLTMSKHLRCLSCASSPALHPKFLKFATHGLTERQLAMCHSKIWNRSFSETFFLACLAFFFSFSPFFSFFTSFRSFFTLCFCSFSAFWASAASPSSSVCNNLVSVMRGLWALGYISWCCSWWLSWIWWVCSMCWSRPPATDKICWKLYHTT